MSQRPSRRNQPSLTRYVRLGALWILIAAICGGLAVAALSAINQPPDPVALCRSGKAFAASTMILIDTTDTLTEVHRRRLAATVAAAADHMPRGGKLTILAINADDAGQPRELASLCNPGTAADADPLFSTQSRVEEAWRTDFYDPITKAVALGLNGEAADASPIIGTISAALTRPDFDARVSDRRLIIVSDMLENQPGVYSQMDGGDFWSEYQHSALTGEDRPDLKGISVTIDYLVRDKYAALQGKAHRRFWQHFLAVAGAPRTAFIGLNSDMDAEPVQIAKDQKTPKPAIVGKKKEKKDKKRRARK